MALWPTTPLTLATTASVGGWLAGGDAASMTVFSVALFAKVPCATCVQVMPSALVKKRQLAMVPLPPPGRGRYLKPPTARAPPRLTVKLCGSGTLVGDHWVCQNVLGSPSTALAATPFSPDTSWLSALTLQPAREMTAPPASSRLNSAIEVHGLPLISESASSLT